MAAYVYAFADGSSGMRDVLGGKGAELAEMTSIGLPVPDGFTVTTEACRAYLAAGGTWPEGLNDQVSQHLSGLEERCGRRLGDPDDPLLVSVRSGSPVSMPGMMDTILNLGLNPRSVEGLARSSGNERFAGTPTAGSCRCTPTSSSACTATSSRRRSPDPSRRAA